jgi:hypothetical protein
VFTFAHPLSLSTFLFLSLQTQAEMEGPRFDPHKTQELAQELQEQLKEDRQLLLTVWGPAKPFVFV